MSTERETAAGAKYWERPLYEQTRAIVSKAAQEYADADSKTDCVNRATREVLALLASQPRSTEGTEGEREMVEEIDKELRHAQAALENAPRDDYWRGVKHGLYAAKRLLPARTEASEGEPVAWLVEGVSGSGEAYRKVSAERPIVTFPYARERVVPLYRRAERAEPDGALRRAWDINWLQNILDRAREGEPTQAEPAWAYDRLIVLAGSLLEEAATAPQRAGTEGDAGEGR